MEHEEFAEKVKSLIALLDEVQKFGEEHEFELEEFYVEFAEFASGVLASLTTIKPELIKFVDELRFITEICTRYGYYKGRNYIEVPKVFKQ